MPDVGHARGERELGLSVFFRGLGRILAGLVSEEGKVGDGVQRNVLVRTHGNVVETCDFIRWRVRVKSEASAGRQGKFLLDHQIVVGETAHAVVEYLYFHQEPLTVDQSGLDSRDPVRRRFRIGGTLPEHENQPVFRGGVFGGERIVAAALRREEDNAVCTLVVLYGCAVGISAVEWFACQQNGVRPASLHDVEVRAFFGKRLAAQRVAAA